MTNCNVVYDNESGLYIISNATIFYPNFSGAKTEMNEEGKRNFRLVLPQDLGEELLDRGVNVKVRPPMGEYTEPEYSIKVGVYGDSDVRFEYDGRTFEVHPNELYLVDDEFRSRRVMNGSITIAMYVARSKRPGGNLYIVGKEIKIPLKKSYLFNDNPIERLLGSAKEDNVFMGGE